MATNVIMPSLGFDMTEGKVAAWLKAAGDPVEKGEPLVEIETEKATVEVESPASGILARIVVEPGKSVPVGTVIGIVAAAGEAVPGAPGETPDPAAPPPEAPAAPAATSPPAQPAPAAAQPEAPAAPASPHPAGGRVKASPLARRMAEEAGIDLASIAGTGDEGRVMERDVESAIAARGAAPKAAPPGEAASAASAAAPAPQPLSRMRQAIARRMAESKATAPHFYATVEVRMDAALKWRRRGPHQDPAHPPFSVNDLVLAAAARTLKGFPALNSSWRDGSIVTHPEVGIGIAVDLEDGLVTPVLHGADKKSLAAISEEAHALARRARAGKLRPEDLSGGTFTVSNMSMLGVDDFIAIINPPEAAILAVGAVVRRPVADGDAIRVAQVMRVTLSVDHRVSDGATAARFLQALRALLENPAELIGQ